MDIEIACLEPETQNFERHIGEIARATRTETHLLSQNPETLELAARDGRLLVAVDKADSRFLGCVALWELTRDENGASWYELGTLYVDPAYRFRQINISIADMLYRALLDKFSDRNILGTTTNPNAIKAGLRAGLVHVGFRALPDRIHRATCVCPSAKTGSSDNRFCRLKDRGCVVRVSSHTWQRLNCPCVCEFPSCFGI